MVLASKKATSFTDLLEKSGTNLRALRSFQNREAEKRSAEMVDENLVSVEQACELLQVHRNTLYSLIHRGEIPAIQFVKRGRWKFRRSDLREWLEDRQER